MGENVEREKSVTRREFLTGLMLGLFGSRAIFRALAATSKGGQWFPGIIHAHSNFSDGTRSASDVQSKAISSGAKFLIETDHYEQIARTKRHSFQTSKASGFANYRGAFQSSSGLIVFPGTEIIARYGDHNTHTLALGEITQDTILDKLQGRDGVQQDLINRLGEMGLLAVAAHPNAIGAGSFAANPTEPTNYVYDRAKAKDLRGIEFFNENAESTSRTMAWYLPLSVKSDVFVISGCDEHYPVDKADGERWRRLTYVWVEGGLNEESLMAALRAGRTYAAQNGARIEELNFLPGFAIQRTEKPEFRFRLVFPDKTKSRKTIILYRDGMPVTGQNFPNRLREYRIRIADQSPSPGKHTYVIVVEGQLITSPIRLEIAETGGS